MKKGIHYWALPQGISLREKMHFAKSLGFDGLELVIVENGELPPDCDSKKLEEIRWAAKEEEIEIVALSNSENWNCSFTSEDPAVREKAKDTLIRQIQMTEALGSEVALALPGFVSVDFIADDLHPSVRTHGERQYHPGREIIDYEKAYIRSVQAFREIAAVAGQHHVVVGIENIWSGFLLSPLEMRDFIDEIGSEYVKAYFDIGNVLPWGHPEQWIRILGSRIRRVHVKDYRYGCNSVNGFVNLLSGDIDFVKVTDALREAGYDGWITAEVNEKRDFPEFAARVSSIALDSMLAERSENHV